MTELLLGPVRGIAADDCPKGAIALEPLLAGCIPPNIIDVLLPLVLLVACPNGVTLEDAFCCPNGVVELKLNGLGDAAMLPITREEDCVLLTAPNAVAGGGKLLALETAVVDPNENVGAAALFSTVVVTTAAATVDAGFPNERESPDEAGFCSEPVDAAAVVDPNPNEGIAGAVVTVPNEGIAGAVVTVPNEGAAPKLNVGAADCVVGADELKENEDSPVGLAKAPSKPPNEEMEGAAAVVAGAVLPNEGIAGTVLPKEGTLDAGVPNEGIEGAASVVAGAVLPNEGTELPNDNKAGAAGALVAAVDTKVVNNPAVVVGTELPKLKEGVVTIDCFVDASDEVVVALNWNDKGACIAVVLVLVTNMEAAVATVVVVAGVMAPNENVLGGFDGVSTGATAAVLNEKDNGCVATDCVACVPPNIGKTDGVTSFPSSALDPNRDRIVGVGVSGFSFATPSANPKVGAGLSTLGTVAEGPEKENEGIACLAATSAAGSVLAESELGFKAFTGEEAPKEKLRGLAASFASSLF